MAETEKAGIDRKNVLGLLPEEIRLNCIYHEKEFE